MSIFDFASQGQPEQPQQVIPPEQLEETTLVEPVYVTIVRNNYYEYLIGLERYGKLIIIFRILLDYVSVFRHLQIYFGII